MINGGAGPSPDNQVQRLTPLLLFVAIVAGCGGGGGSGAPVYRHWDTEDQCVDGLMVEITSETTHLVQQEYLF